MAITATTAHINCRVTTWREDSKWGSSFAPASTGLTAAVIEDAL
ncbi:MAG: hypothetical protein WDO73_33555 [Ignavibacteriota bacterium]